MITKNKEKYKDIYQEGLKDALKDKVYINTYFDDSVLFDAYYTGFKFGLLEKSGNSKN